METPVNGEWSNFPRYKLTLSKTQEITDQQADALIAGMLEGGSTTLIKPPTPHKVLELETTDLLLLARNLRDLADQLTKVWETQEAWENSQRSNQKSREE